MGRCPPALRAVGSPLRRKAARRGRSGSPGQGGKPKKLPAQRLRKDLGRPCPRRSGPAQSGGQPGQLSRPQAVHARPAGPCCAGCRAGLVARLASQPRPCTGCAAAVHTRPGLLAYAPEEFSACCPGSARRSSTGGSGPEPTRSVRSTSAVSDQDVELPADGRPGFGCEAQAAKAKAQAVLLKCW